MSAGPKILVVGGGGREHALVQTLHDSPEHPVLFAAPGNPGMEPDATRLPMAATDVAGITAWARAERPDLAVIGPDNPLALGIADALRDASVAVLGPGREAARLEWSKVHAKETMKRLGIPTAPFRVARGAEEARRLIAESTFPIVIKADGLAAGKGVVIARDPAQAEATVASWMERGSFGDAGRTVVLEEHLDGVEASILVLTDGERWMLFPPARDHKRLGEGDVGPNTGGMGAYAPAPPPEPGEALALAKGIVDPLLADLRSAGHPFRGVLYLGMMIGRSGARVLEFNARFGDPEAQVVLPLLTEDALPLFLAAASGSIPADRHGTFVAHAGAAVCVVLAARGYPEAPKTGAVVEGLDRRWPHGIRIYHAGIDRRGARWVTSGGRVLGVSARADSLGRAREAVYAAASQIHFEGVHYRRDIAAAAHPSPGKVVA